MDPSESEMPQHEMNEPAETQEAAEEGPTVPPFYKRMVDVFFNPGALVEALAAKPVFGAAVLAGVVLIAVQMALIPVEVFMEIQREAILESGNELPEISDTIVQVTKIATPIFAAISTALFTFIFAGVYTLIFAFILGDEGRYRQYLSVTAHAWLIPLFFGLLITPLRISTGNPQLTMNLGSFMFFLEDGYLLNVFKAFDLTQIWASLVIAQGATAIDSRRSFGSAAAFIIGLLLVVALIAARFMP
ncbi:MAG: hypothetical protein HN396_03550 [Gemmatimonadales bacterium]|jgi:hypothetical protein|nr:hypothetical protein [Gemmatimonadales bacterium]MDG2239914.1 hypothetical protein [Longimicrobiales bacterium]NCG31565.1 hypothetical protein [Pseudomonadota bacterium]MBT3499222.1 hypothetical protein [Gemmatimonadales bacterium]MBT3774011.1 hypothetical protein [Gemmatimonadales bacterium]